MSAPASTPAPPDARILPGVALALWCAVVVWVGGGWESALITAAVLAVAGVAVLVRVRSAPVGRTRPAARAAWFAVLILGAPAAAMGARRLLGVPRAAETWASYALDASLVAAMVAAAHALEYARRQREQELAALRVEAEVARLELERGDAELRALRAQLDPGFLQDALAAAARLLRTTPPAAEALVVRLADLLRRAMSGAAPAGGALWEEMDASEPFLEVERLRLDGLRVEWAVDDDALDGCLPPGVFQPLIGAVLRGRGVAPGTGARLRVAARRRGEWLEVEARGEGLAARGDAADGGAELRTRLEHGCGDAFQLERAPDRVLLRLPWRDEPPGAAPPHLTTPRIDEAAVPPPRASLIPWAGVLALYAVAVWGEYADVVGTRTASGEVVTPVRAYGALFITGTALVHLACRAFRAGVARRRSAHGWRGMLRAHAATAAGATLLLLAADIVSRVLLRGWGSAAGGAEGAILLVSLAGYAVLFTAVAVLADALEFARQHRERPRAELRLRARLARAELDRTTAELRALRGQLDPHFLFNALHAALERARTAPEAAAGAVERLAEILRHALAGSPAEVPLHSEMETLAPFLELERLRLDGRLRVEWAVDDEAWDALVPHMLLQPLAENALKHGIAPAGGGALRIEAARSGDWLRLAVCDDGAGLASTRREGIGLANTRARLAALYGTRFALELAPGEGRGAVVRLRIPWHTRPTP